MVLMFLCVSSVNQLMGLPVSFEISFNYSQLLEVLV